MLVMVMNSVGEMNTRDVNYRNTSNCSLEMQMNRPL